jgi:transglutaminase-like putative cysteine protease
MRRLRVRHETVYRYARPVSFGEHRMMFRPRDSHDLRLLEATLAITPKPSDIRWVHDVFGNSVAIARFSGPAAELRFESEISLDHFEAEEPSYPIAEHARIYPISYDGSEIPDLSRLIERGYPDPAHAVDSWAKAFLVPGIETWSLLTSMTRAVQRDFRYDIRIAEGVQNPADTLQRRSGTCRDFALLMMEAVRSLGFAARFVSGYVHSLDEAGAGRIGAGSTHAWLQIYLPGAGWTEFDPTNGIVGNRDLIRVAVARDPAQASPLSGSYVGAAEDFLGISVDVVVSLGGEHAG